MSKTAQERRQISISGNWRPGGPEMEWAGSGYVDQYGHIECGADLGDAYEAIEEQIEDGQTEGSVTVHDAEQDRDITYSWTIEGGKMSKLTWTDNRWHLDGKPIHAGTVMEIRGFDREWFLVRIESSDSGRKLIAVYRVHGLEFTFPIDPGLTKLRWPRGGR